MANTPQTLALALALALLDATDRHAVQRAASEFGAQGKDPHSALLAAIHLVAQQRGDSVRQMRKMAQYADRGYEEEMRAAALMEQRAAALRRAAVEVANAHS